MSFFSNTETDHICPQITLYVHRSQANFYVEIKKGIYNIELAQ